jgi:Ca2+-binding RTX toxin-like protein
MPIVLADRLLPEDFEGLQPGRQSIVQAGGTTYVVSTVDPELDAEYGLIVTRLAASGALLDASVFASDDPLSGMRFAGGGITTLTIGGETLVYFAGAVEGRSIFGDPTMAVLSLTSDGTPSLVESFEWGVDRAGVPQNALDPQTVQVGGGTFVVQANYTGREITAFQVGSDGRLSEKDTANLAFGNARDALTTVTVGGRAFVIASDAHTEPSLAVFGLDADGAFERIGSSPPNEPLIDNRIVNDLQTAKVGNRTFVFSSENSKGSIAVHQLGRDGSLELVGYETHHSDADTWTYPHALAAFEVRGQTFLAAGGGGASLVVFAVSNRGALVEVDEFVLGDRFEGRWINDIDVTKVGGKTLIVASNEAEGSLDSFRFTPGAFETRGGGGGDRIVGRARDDLVRSGGGNDVVDGKRGGDLIEGGGGKDRLTGGLGDDDIDGGAGRDSISGGEGSDWLIGGSGNDQIKGGNHLDFMRGGGGNDRGDGGDGDDRLFGDAGDDRLRGGVGEDVLEDGAGRDTLAGGTFGDRFVLIDDGARDRIVDFEDGDDLIDLTAEGDRLIFPDIRIQKSGNGLLITYGDDTIVLTPASGSLKVGDIGLDDFLLA